MEISKKLTMKIHHTFISTHYAYYVVSLKVTCIKNAWWKETCLQFLFHLKILLSLQSSVVVNSAFVLVSAEKVKVFPTDFECHTINFWIRPKNKEKVTKLVMIFCRGNKIHIERIIVKNIYLLSVCWKCSLIWDIYNICCLKY